MKNMSVKKIVAMIVGAAAVLAVAAVAAVLALTMWRAGTLEQILHTGQQLNTWLPQTTQQTEPEEVSSEGLWNEYSYEIINGDTWYDIEISGFGSVTELETVSSQYPRG